MQRTQARNEDARQYYSDKLRLFVQAYPPARRSLVEFKTDMLLELYNAELRKTFMPKEIKHGREIKAVLDHQLVNLRTYNMDPRAPAQDMSGLHSTVIVSDVEDLEWRYMLFLQENWSSEEGLQEV